MSNISQCKGIIFKLKDMFNDKSTTVEYGVEAGYAVQSLQNNEKLLETAIKNPVSLQSAVLNIAAIGISLNPASKLAYLVPRDGKVCLDISYIGLIKLATDTGSIAWVKAEVVCEKDKYIHNGPAEKPTHTFDPFRERGKKIGVYCIAKTENGDYLTEAINSNEILKIRSVSKGANSHYSPWNNYEDEMWKKSVIKRASKTWPKTQKIQRLDLAIEAINEHEGVDFNSYSREQMDYFKTLVKKKDASGLFVFMDSLKIEQQVDIVGDYCKKAQKGTKTKTGQEIKSLQQEGHKQMLDMLTTIESSSDDCQIDEIKNEISNDELSYLTKNLSPENQCKLNRESVVS